MTKVHASLLAKAILISGEDLAKPLLVVEIGLDCPACGQHTFRIAGHHMRTLRKLCTEVIDSNPDYCGDEDSIKTLDTETFSLTPHGDPRNN